MGVSHRATPHPNKGAARQFLDFQKLGSISLEKVIHRWDLQYNKSYNRITHRVIMKLTKPQIESIPYMIAQGMTAKTIALGFEVHERTINYWVKQLRKNGVKINLKRGPKRLLDN